MTAMQVLLEFQRDWANTDHCDEVMAMIKPTCPMTYQEDRVATMAVNSKPSPAT
jgi:hypothetical protein